MERKFVFEDLRQMGLWMRRKIKDRVEGREYVFTREDFNDLSRVIRVGNWMMPRFGHTRFYRFLVDRGFFAPYFREPVISRVVPLNAKVKTAPNSVVPLQLLDELIEKAGFRFIMDKCFCRQGMECQDYPIELGCLDLGEGARVLLKGPHGREVSLEEAKAHVRKAGELGLPAFLAHAIPENQLMGIPKEQNHKFLEACFCCPCCCVAMSNLKYYSPIVKKNNMVSIGFVAKALPTCQGCYECVTKCAAGAIKVKGDKVWVQEDLCIGCGICQHACPHHAIRLIQVSPLQENLLDYFNELKLDLS